MLMEWLGCWGWHGRERMGMAGGCDCAGGGQRGGAADKRSRPRHPGRPRPRSRALGRARRHRRRLARPAPSGRPQPPLYWPIRHLFSIAHGPVMRIRAFTL